ncbi:DUF6407 family protein [Bacillus timonensis]|nr:DUF6407 family protein [Bacillus timonensis]
MSANLTDFVKNTIAGINNYEKDNLECNRELVRKAIEFYKMQSYEEVETTEQGTTKLLHVRSMAEENLLSKIVDIALERENECGIEEVYESRVIREY